ncbi:hypothetical protein [Nonomuraea sp. NPDC049480]|uniref:hypothetical protein n=1 Tax=Nonomuraea sp. NPDC049480 TaxID=3364353 RepID=UPI0037B3CEED
MARVFVDTNVLFPFSLMDLGRRLIGGSAVDGALSGRYDYVACNRLRGGNRIGLLP